MKYNSKLVSFDRSAAYVHHRAMKNLRENNLVDALELMRHAVERSPENQEYLLDLAEIYCELGCHEQSNRILLDMISKKDAPAECYYGLALNQYGRNEMDSARQALDMYAKYAGDGEYAQDATELKMELDFFSAIKRPIDRRLARAVHVANNACDALREDQPQKACALFERSLAMEEDQPEMRALYAMALKICGREAAAIEAIRKCLDAPEPSLRTLSVCGQVLRMCGHTEKGIALVERAAKMHPEAAEQRLLCFVLCDMGMYERAGELLKAALRDEPYDKELLHLRAVALHHAGAPDSQCAPFWLRILRIDPEDSVARYYHDAAAKGMLSQIHPEFVYQLPDAEHKRRLLKLLECLSGGIEQSLIHWREDRSFRELLIWAVGTGDDNCGRAAVMVIASADDALAESVLREMMFRGDIPMSVKLHALLFLHLRGADVASFLPPGCDLYSGMLPDSDSMLKAASVGERQLVRYAGEYLYEEEGNAQLSALMLLWRRYRTGCAGGVDPLLCTQEAAAALVWNYLLRRGDKASMKKLQDWFGANPRRLVFYARRMAAVLDRIEGTEEHEDH